MCEKGDESKTSEETMRNKFDVWEALKSIIANNIDYYKNDESESGLKIRAALLGIIDQLDLAYPLICDIEDFCGIYDFDAQTTGNGYRSFLKVFDCAIDHTNNIIQYVTVARSNFLFRKATYMKEIDACNHVLAALVTILNHLITLHSSSENGNLFPIHFQSPEDVVERAKTINQFAFYGRALGFQFCDSIKPLQKFLGIAMASYSEAYYSKGGTFLKATKSMFTSGKYFLDPELRARRIVSISQNSSVEFTKSFWFLAENEIMSIINTAYQKVAVNRLIKVKTEPLKISHDIELPAIGHIQVRLISAHEREGMIRSDKNETTFTRNTTQILPKSKSLLIHAHGGGFIAQSSQSHLLYLNEWAEELSVPILSIDYSLAPESPYPIALNEVFYVYCWALENAEILGSTCENIVLAGDSAGANLCLAATLKCIDSNIRKPDGVFIAYCPVLVAFDPSPSRMLCMLDPLLPFGFLMRCLKAYSNAESLSEQQRRSSDKGYFDEIEDIKRAKAEHNEELKRKSSMNNGLNNETEFGIIDDDLSDSFEEISCFERHQTESNLQAHISQASDASNDTLAGASFITNTDNRNSNFNDTLEVTSPIDSIRSATSLEEDSLPITMKKSSNNDEQQATSSYHSDETNEKYVDEFIGKYVLDAKKCDDGIIKPVLRKTSKTISKDNIVFDISKDTLKMTSIHRKVQRVASSLVDGVSYTFSEITKTNQPITRNLSCDEGDETRTLDNGSSSTGVPESSSSDFIFNVPKDPFLSPLYADDHALKQFPATNILSLSLDPCLDDSIEFAKKLRDLNVKVRLDVLDGLPHGFLNFAKLSKEAHDGSKLSIARIAELLRITLDKDETKVKYFC